MNSRIVLGRSTTIRGLYEFVQNLVMRNNITDWLREEHFQIPSNYQELFKSVLMNFPIAPIWINRDSNNLDWEKFGRKEILFFDHLFNYQDNPQLFLNCETQELEIISTIWVKEPYCIPFYLVCSSNNLMGKAKEELTESQYAFLQFVYNRFHQYKIVVELLTLPNVVELLTLPN